MNQLDTDKIAQLEDQTDEFRALTLKERGELLIAACRAAATIEQGRLASGLPPVQPAPWPESTWELMRRYAPHGKQPPPGD